MSAHIQSMFYAGQDIPWHRFGRQVGAEGLLTLDALKAAGLDWSVSKVSLFEQAPSGEFFRVPGVYGMRRSDTLRCFESVSVGDRYEPMQNEALLGVADALSKVGGVTWETAGALFDGRRVWALGRAPGAFEVREGDVHLPYLLAYTSHDGSSATELLFTDVRVVCWNTLSLARKQADNRARIRHTASAGSRLDEAAEALGIMHASFQAEAELRRSLAAKRMALEEFLTFATRLLDIPEDVQGRSATIAADKCATLAELFRGGNGNRGETRDDALNAVTEFVDFQRGRMAQTRKRFESALFGSGAKLKEKARTLLAA